MSPVDSGVDSGGPDVDVEQTVRLDPPTVRRAVMFVTLLVPVVFVLSLPSIGAVSGVAAVFAVIGSACVAVVVWRRGMDDDMTMAALAVFMDVEGILAGLLIPSGLAYAVLLPSVGVAASAGMRNSRVWAVLAVTAPLAGAVGTIAAFSWGPRAAVLNLPKPAATVALLGAISAGALTLLWRARRRHERAVEVAVEAARRSAEDAAELARTRELLTAILGAAPFAIVSADLQGVVRYFSPAAEQQLGIKASEALGRQVTEVAAMSPQEYGQLYERLVAGEVVRLEPVRRGNVDERSVVAPIRGPNGEVVGAVSITEDVTDRIRLESELRQSQKMETLGQLSGAIAHDFNNLLQAIRGYAELAMLSATNDTELASNLGEIRKAADRAADLTHQLLAFSQPGIAGARVVDVNETIEQCTPMIRRLVGPAVELTTTLDPNAGRAFIDPSQLQQAILNLAVNARDAMPGGGSLTIETLCPEDEPGKVRLVVRDTGTGIPDDIRHRIFDPFFTTKELGKGTGLGLTIVNSIVSRAGGEVRVDPEPDHGTRFSVSLPAVETALPERPEASEPDARGTETVLLVEDEEAIRRLAQRVLTRHGYVVLAASGADEARQIWQERGSEVDLLLSDVTMPGLSGPALAAELPGNPRTLFISGHLPNDPSMVFHIEKAHFLQKPFTVSELLGAVRETLDAG
jgi:PAS domain S-box-containing protein